MSNVLIVEDEILVAMLLQEKLEDVGYHVVGPASSVSEARIMVTAQALQGAVVDMNLAGGEADAADRSASRKRCACPDLDRHRARQPAGAVSLSAAPPKALHDRGTGGCRANHLRSRDGELSRLEGPSIDD